MIPIVLRHGGCVHRAHENGQMHHPMVEGRAVQNLNREEAHAEARRVLNQLLHGQQGYGLGGTL